MMAIKRRPLLQLAAGLLLPGLSGCQNSAAGNLLSGYRRRQGGGYGIAVLDAAGRLLFNHKVPQRVHQAIVRPGSSQAYFIGRRPGTAIYAMDIISGQLLPCITAPAQRHFYGHACFSQDGRYLYVPENHVNNVGAGIGVYDGADGFRRIDEINLSGIGPHQIELLSDGDTLVLALGGILTHPSRGRDKLNIDSMQSALLYIDSRSGKTLAEYRPPSPRQSIRHMALASNDTVIVGVQTQGDKSQPLPLAYRHQGEQALQSLQASAANWARHKHYVGSVCIDDKGQQCWLSSPRGGLISRWHVGSGELQEIISQRDVCGLAYNSQRQNFYASNGNGQVLEFDREQTRQSYFDDLIWDNHMVYAELS